MNSENLKNENDIFPDKLDHITHTIFKMIQYMNEMSSLKNKAYLDLMDRFPRKSSLETQYVFIMYDYDTNDILCQALKSIKEKEINGDFDKCYNKVIKHNNKPTFFITNILMN